MGGVRYKYISFTVIYSHIIIIKKEIIGAPLRAQEDLERPFMEHCLPGYGKSIRGMDPLDNR